MTRALLLSNSTRRRSAIPLGSSKPIPLCSAKPRMQLEIARPTRVDVDFRMQFEMARPSREYSALLKLPPNIYVGRGDRLQCIVKMLCECMKNSLKKTGMHIPPWRKFK